MTRKPIRAAVIAFAGILTISIPFVLGQESRERLFQEVLKARAQADEVQASVYSPTHYKNAAKDLAQAESDFEKGKTESLADRLKTATDTFIKAAETSRLFQSQMSEAHQAREDAVSAGAPKYREKQWLEAENILGQAARSLEQGDLRSAESRAERAAQDYRTVELESIKAHYLDETRSLIAEAEKQDIAKKAPESLTKARTLSDKAEKLLAENRYDTDEARQLAQEAKYEAMHARYLAQTIDAMDKKATLESLLLKAEDPIRKIGDEFGLNLQFDQGSDPSVETILQEIRKLRKEIASLKQDLEDRNEQIAAFEKQNQNLAADLASVRSEMGDLKSKEAELTALVDRQRQARETFNQVESKFTSGEAQVLRTEDQVIIRLYGLTFPVGKATIEAQYFPLLGKVLQAIDLYPGSGVTVEGHTDSRGGDEANQKLSQMRAESVWQYFLASAKIDSSRVIAVGYGEAKPIATNDTEDGRRKNRRIDIIVHPKKE